MFTVTTVQEFTDMGNDDDFDSFPIKLPDPLESRLPDLATETIDLDALWKGDLTSSGTFDLGEERKSRAIQAAECATDLCPSRKPVPYHNVFQ